MVDPSHGIGLRKYVLTMALAGVAAGADVLLVEIHQNPNQTTTDAQQTINFENFTVLVKK